MSTGPGTRSFHFTSSTVSPSKRSSREPELDAGHELNLGDEFDTGDFHLKSPTISPSKRSSREPELDPGHELNLGSDLNLGNGFGAGRGIPGPQLTTRIAQLRRDVRPCVT